VTGPNGSGKSTLLRVLAGLLRPAAGRVSLEGIGEAGDAPGVHTHYLGHLDGLKSALTTRENLAFWAAVLDPGAGRARPGLDPAEALRLLGLAHATDLPVSFLSAGQKRRVALARLLCASRPLWLLDEPTTALDVASQQRLSEMIGEHRAGGGLLVLATHAPLDLPEARVLRLTG